MHPIDSWDGTTIAVLQGVYLWKCFNQNIIFVIQDWFSKQRTNFLIPYFREWQANNKLDINIILEKFQQMDGVVISVGYSTFHYIFVL